jgi:hypothetical protein
MHFGSGPFYHCLEVSIREVIRVRLEHDPEKCVAVFRKDHAQTKG